jgi:hypothetical protein
MKVIQIIIFFCYSIAYGQSSVNLIPFYKNDKWGFADTSMNIVVPPTYDYVTSFKNGYAIIKKNGLFGLMDSTTNIVVPIEYKNGFDLTEDLSWTRKDFDWIILNKQGIEIFPEYKYYSRPYGFMEGLSRVIRNGKYGFVNELGKETLKCIYDSSSYGFKEGFAEVRIGKKWGYINKNGEVIVDFKYDYADNFEGGRAIVMDRQRGYGFIDTTGKEIIPLKYQYASPFFEGLAYVKVKNKIGFINKEGNFLIKPRFNYSGIYQNGFAYVGNNLSSKIYNRKGKCVMTSFRYVDIDYFNEGLAPVNTRREKYGYIDTTGKLVIKLKYDFALEFHNGLAAVEKNEKWGYLNRKGELIIPIIYEDYAPEFEDNVARVKRKGKEFYIDTKGKEYISW